MSHYRYPQDALAAIQEDRASVDAYAWHAAASNGFGDAGLGSLPRADAVAAATARPAARKQTGVLETVLHFVALRLRAARRGWWMQRRARDTDVALSALDDRGLRDLGFHRSEISSVATGMRRHGDPTRARMSQALQGMFV